MITVRREQMAPIVIDDPKVVAWLHGVVEVIANKGHEISAVSPLARLSARSCASSIHTAIEDAMPWTRGLPGVAWREIEGGP